MYYRVPDGLHPSDTSNLKHLILSLQGRQEYFYYIKINLNISLKTRLFCRKELSLYSYRRRINRSELHF